MADDVAELENHRPALTGHCYRMLGSAVDADDAAQETMIRAWKGLDGFDGRASMRTWLYRIATNVCLDHLADRGRRHRAIDVRPAGSTSDPLTQLPPSHWIEPIPDVRAIPADANPAEYAILRQSIRLAFVAALQHLAPKQRAALLLMDVLGWSAAEAADTLDTSVAAANSALQRARATIASRNVAIPGAAPSEELSDPQRELLDRYVAAFECYDVDQLVTLMRQDVAFSMPPLELWLEGPSDVRAWMFGRGSACKGSRLIPVIAACGSPAFAQYCVSGASHLPGECDNGSQGGHQPFGLVVLELCGAEIAGVTTFLDTATLFPLFGLPMHLPAVAA